MCVLWEGRALIPAYTISGFLPPFIGESSADRAGASPYAATLEEVAERFAITDARVAILTGLIAYRRRLRDIGASAGTQWLDGSFFEDVERTRGRPPGDIDLLTFSRLPFMSASDTIQLIDKNPDVFDPGVAKQMYHCDAYFVDLNKKPELIVSDTAYFFGLFSHERAEGLWKGLVAVPLGSDDTGLEERLR